ncbi:MAG: DUF1570 domain-containing protein [Planctomycetes bacterium]|nr:DUF1570 domain-containing protein [Planctomycetota bacterium]
MLAAWISTVVLVVAGDEAAFVAGLAEARSLLDKRDFAKAEAKARELVAAHEQQPYVWLHLPEIVDVIETSSFSKSYVEPDPKTLVSGELISWSKSGANLKVRYTPKTMRDFQRIGGQGDQSIWLHPVAFSGGYGIEIRGSSYPFGTRTAIVPTILFCMDERDGQAAVFGFSEFASGGRSYLSNAHLRVRRDGEWSDDTSQVAAPCIGGRSFDLKVKVEDTRVAVTSGGKPLFDGKKRSTVYGKFGLGGFTRFDELVVSGRAHPGWLQGKLDEHYQQRWEWHAKHWRKESPLPEWLELESIRKERGFAFDLAELPVAVEPDVIRAIEKAFASKAGEIQKSFDALERLTPEQVPDGSRAWLSALLLYRGRQLNAALKECDRVVGAAPAFAPAQHLRARLLSELDRRSESLAALRALAAAVPDDDRVVLDLAEAEFAEGNLDELTRLLRERAERGRYNRELDELNALASRAANGPGWSKPLEVKTAHYVVASDIDRKTCVEAAEMLENSLARFQARLGPLPKERAEPFRVYLFSGFAGYRRYVRDALDSGAENTAGMYHMGLEQLLIWNQPDHEGMLRTVRHEGLHQFVDQSIGELPRWLNEGLAELYENAEFTRGPSRELLTHPEHLFVLRADDVKLVSLAEFVRQDAAQFMADPEVSYAQAWALVHFLMTSSDERKALVDGLLTRARAGEHPADAVEHAFAGVDFARLERDFVEHVAALSD